MNSFFKKTGLFLPIPLLVILNSILALSTAPEFESLGPGTTTDSYYYLKLAKELPYIWDATFPVLYPLVIKIINIFTDNYFIASKIFCLIAVLFVYIYSYLKNFFWKEIWVIFSTASFLETNYWTWSETLYAPLLVVFSHLSYLYLLNPENRKNLIWKLSIVLILIFMTRYSGMFIIAAIGIYILLYYWIKKKILYPLLISCAISSLFIIFYLFYNKYLTGFTTGPREHSFDMKDTLNIRLSFFNVFYVLNPVINSRLIWGYKINYILLFIISLLLYIPVFVKIIKKQWMLNIRNLYFLNLGIVFLGMNTLSYFIYKIDDLNSRLLLPYIFFIFLFIAIVAKTWKNQYLLLISYLSLTISILNNIYIF